MARIVAKRSLLWILTCAFVVAPALFVSTALDGLTGNERGRSWVSAHAESLPTSYDAFLAFPYEYRRAIFGHWSTTNKAEFWREHLTRALRTEIGLNEAQRTFIRRVIALNTQESWDEFVSEKGKPRAEMTGGLATAWRQIPTLFDAELHRRLFMELGSRTASPRTIQTAMLSIQTGIRNLSVVQAAYEECDCDRDCGLSDCSVSQCYACWGCYFSAGGCCDGGGFDCNGLCATSVPPHCE